MNFIVSIDNSTIRAMLNLAVKSNIKYILEEMHPELNLTLREKDEITEMCFNAILKDSQHELDVMTDLLSETLAELESWQPILRRAFDYLDVRHYAPEVSHDQI